MTKPLIELVEEYGEARYQFAAGLDRRNQSRADALLSEIRQRLSELEANERRYLWLRDKSLGQFEHPIVVSQHRDDIGMRYVGPLVSDRLDKAIDAAIDASRAEGGGRG